MVAYLSHLCQLSPVSLVVTAHNTGNDNLDKEEKSVRKTLGGMKMTDEVRFHLMRLH